MRVEPVLREPNTSSFIEPGAMPVRSISLVMREPLKAPPLGASSNSSVSPIRMPLDAGVS